MASEIFIVGGDSLIGSALVSYLSKTGHKVIASTRRKDIYAKDRIYLDLAESSDRWVLPNKQDTAVLCAGITDVDACEKKPVETALVNVEATCILADKLVKTGTHIIFLSSNQVFAGTSPYPSPKDSVSPITEYGGQKAETERKLLSLFPDKVTILRLTKVIGNTVPLFDKWERNLKAGNTVSPFSDMYMAPIPLSDVITVLHLFIENRLTGIHHFSADQDISCADVAYELARITGATAEQVRPIRALNSGLVHTPFPLKTALNMNSLKRKFGIQPPEALRTIRQYFIN